MILLYVDESGDFTKVGQHFVLGAVAIPENLLLGVRRRIDHIIRSRLPEHLGDTEIHTVEVRNGGGVWRGIHKPVRAKILRDLGAYLGSIRDPGFSLFGVVRSPNAVTAADPLERCYEELLLRFTEMLIRRKTDIGHQMGLVVADEARYEKLIQPIVQRWRLTGTRIKPLRRLAEVPLFVDSKATRLIQAADFVAHVTYRHYSAGQTDLLGALLPAFDHASGVMHGLCHLVPNYRTCPCPACVSRASARQAARGPLTAAQT